MGVLDCAIVSEELAFGCTGIQTAMEANGLAVRVFFQYGLFDLYNKFFPNAIERVL